MRDNASPGKRRSMSLLQVKEFAPDMCPTCRFLNAPTFVDSVEAGITIGLQRPTEIAQVLLWMITFPMAGGTVAVTTGVEIVLTRCTSGLDQRI